MIRKIFNLHKSAVVAIPTEILRKVGIRRGQKVSVTSSKKTIRIKDFKNK